MLLEEVITIIYIDCISVEANGYQSTIHIITWLPEKSWISFFGCFCLFLYLLVLLVWFGGFFWSFFLFLGKQWTFLVPSVIINIHQFLDHSQIREFIEPSLGKKPSDQDSTSYLSTHYSSDFIFRLKRAIECPMHR